MSKNATPYLFSLYQKENITLDLIVKKMNADPLQDRKVDRSKVIRSLITSAMRRHKVSNSDVKVAMLKAAKTELQVVD